MHEPTPLVLLAESDPVGREALLRYIADAGYRVRSAASGVEVVSLCDVDPPDVLILNTALPDLDGFEVCGYVRRETRGCDLTVIFLSDAVDGLERAYLRQMVEFAGGDYFLARPFDVHVLVQLLDDLVGSGAADEVRRRRPSSPTRVVWPTARPAATVG